MRYVEVVVASTYYHKNEPLTYSSESELPRGAIVTVPLRNKEVTAVVTSEVPKPAFPTKSILDAPDLPPLPQALLKLLDWMREYYPAPLGITAQLFLPTAITKTSSRSSTSQPKPSRQPTALPPLTKDQDAALKSISSPGSHILHGETGSGKTRVYIELAKRNLEQNLSSIILTPEIGLTSQLTNDFASVFGDDRIVVMHSGLTAAARRRAWQHILTTEEPLIIIGARSALFSPLKNLGLIVIDESHETSYKQDQAPYYHATPVAAKLASLHRASLVLGSATPPITDYYVASSKGRPIIRMTELAAGKEPEKANLQVIDLKDRSQFTKSQHLSTPLIQAVAEKLKNGEQVLLFLNRRGTARVIFCERCGWQATCPHCDLPLVYHGDRHKMRCHSCNYSAASPSNCSSCHSTEIVFKSIGTKAIAEEAKRLFPEAKVMRFDTDNKKDERLEAHYEALRAGKVNMIIGTQTIAKGLDLPKLGLVGVVIADTSLYFPDFSAQERTYQLLVQVLGRIGRGHRQSQAIIQTYEPHSHLLESVTTKKWSSFYNKELSDRQQFLFPPFCYLLKLVCKRSSSRSAQAAAEKTAATIRRLKYNIRVEGPAPCFQEKAQNKYAWQLIIKSKRRDHLTSIIEQLPSGWSYDIDPINLL